MRVYEKPTVSFVDINGLSIPVRDMIELSKYETAITIDNQKGAQPDELVTRQEMAGDGAEGRTYKLIEANAGDLVDYDFDFDLLKKIKVPAL